MERDLWSLSLAGIGATAVVFIVASLVIGACSEFILLHASAPVLVNHLAVVSASTALRVGLGLLTLGTTLLFAVGSPCNVSLSGPPPYSCTNAPLCGWLDGGQENALFDQISSKTGLVRG